MGHCHQTRSDSSPPFHHQRRYPDVCLFVRQRFPLHGIALSLRSGTEPTGSTFLASLLQVRCSILLRWHHLRSRLLDIHVCLCRLYHGIHLVPESYHHLFALHLDLHLCSIHHVLQGSNCSRHRSQHVGVQVTIPAIPGLGIPNFLHPDHPLPGLRLHRRWLQLPIFHHRLHRSKFASFISPNFLR
jgi:hypothetical protein